MSKFKELYPLAIFIPSFILLHYGWYKLQYNEDFVPESQRKLDIWSHYKYFFKKDHNSDSAKNNPGEQ